MAPLADDDLGFLQAVEDLTVEQLVAQLAVEAFTIAVLPRTARRDVESLGTHARQPLPHDLGGHFGAVIGSDVFWNPAGHHDIGHRFQNAQAVNPTCDADRQTLAGELVDQGHQPNLSTVMGLGFDEVVGPDMIAPLRSQPDARAVIEPYSASGPLFPGYFQPLTPPDALHAISADGPACFVEQRRDPSVAVTAVLRCQLNDGPCQRVFIGANNDSVTLRAAWLADDPAGLAFRQIVFAPNALNSLPAPFGAYKFPEAISFRICFSSDRSATSRFSRAFSFSRSFILRA